MPVQGAGRPSSKYINMNQLINQNLEKAKEMKIYKNQIKPCD